MPALSPRCIQKTNEEKNCCICKENECSIALSPRGDMILFADGNEVVAQGNRCDCIIVLRRESMIEVYSIELKDITDSNNNVLNPDRLREKWKNCLEWASDIVNKFYSTSQRKINILYYVVFVIPEEVLSRIATLIKRQSFRYRPSSNIGIIQGRILSCNNTITDNAVIF